MTTAPHPFPRPAASQAVNDRAAVAAGYRHLADLIESGACPIPINASISINLGYRAEVAPEDQPAAAAELRRAFGGGHWDKEDFDGYGSSSLILRGMCGGLPIDIWIDRSQVCERVVVGTETVEVPALPATEARTETREVYEWRCGPPLDAAHTTESAEVSA